ncbi:MAG: ATP-grasp domain-containing protein [Sandaracinobacteroides sp.]
MTTVLLTLGRLPKALDLARGFHAAGCRVLVAEPMQRHLTGASRSVAASFRTREPATDHAGYLADLLAIVQREKVDLVVPVSEESMHAGFLHGRLPGATRLAGPDGPTLTRLHSKLGFAEIAQAHGLPIPESARADTPEAGAIAAAGRHVLKPILGCGGRDIRFRDAGSLPDPRPTDLVQRFIDGPHLSSFTLARGGASLVTAVYRGTLLSGSVAVRFAQIENPAVEAWIGRFIAATGYEGFLSFDFILEDGRPLAIECNPRVTSGIHFVAPEPLARALLDPGSREPIPLLAKRERQQFYAVLTEIQSRFWKTGGLAALRDLFATDDVSWDRRDPLPFLTMTYTAWPIIRAARATGLSFGEVATRDIDWTG